MEKQQPESRKGGQKDRKNKGSQKRQSNNHCENLQREDG